MLSLVKFLVIFRVVGIAFGSGKESNYEVLIKNEGLTNQMINAADDINRQQHAENALDEHFNPKAALLAKMDIVHVERTNTYLKLRKEEKVKWQQLEDAEATFEYEKRKFSERRFTTPEAYDAAWKPIAVLEEESDRLGIEYEAHKALLIQSKEDLKKIAREVRLIQNGNAFAPSETQSESKPVKKSLVEEGTSNQIQKQKKIEAEDTNAVKVDKIGEATTHNSQKTTLEIENKIGEETQTTHESSQKEIHGVQEYMDTDPPITIENQQQNKYDSQNQKLSKSEINMLDEPTLNILKKQKKLPIVTFKRVLTGVGILFVSAVIVCALLEWQTNIFHKDPVVAATQRQALIKAGSQSPQKILEGKCKELEAAAAMIEGHAYDTYSIKEYYSLLDSIRTIYGDAYDQATTSGIANSTQLLLENGWIPTAPPPVAPFTPVHASEDQVKKMAIEHEEAQDRHTAEQYLNQIRQEFEVTQQHHKNVHEAAFHSIRGNMTGLSFDADSHQFKIAYIGMYSRMAIPRQCFPHIYEGKVTTERFADLRANQAIQLAKTDLAFDIAFEANSNLPPTPVA